MMMGYVFWDIVSPVSTQLRAPLSEGGMAWTSAEYGFYAGSYSIFNIFFMMLFFGGIILDRCGIRITGLLATGSMFLGACVNAWAVTHVDPTSMVDIPFTLFGIIPQQLKTQVLIAALGFGLFGMGCDITGITVSKIVTKWFKGKELASAMGVQVALARIGSQAAYAVAIPVAKAFGLDMPLFIGLCLLVGGLIAFLAFSLMDLKLDRQVKIDTSGSDEEKFSFSDVMAVVKNPGFWLIAVLCVLFYSCVFPFQKFATELMVTKYGVSEDLAGTFAGLPALGALILTPVFGGMIDRRGKAASIMMLGSAMLIFVHFVYALPFISASWIVIALMIVLGVAFSLVPSAMWPSVAKIFPVKQLGTAYALIFFIQNIGLWGIPALIGYVLEKYCITGTQIVNGLETNTYNYTLPMCIFTSIAVLSLLVGFFLKVADRKYGYGLEKANLSKK